VTPSTLLDHRHAGVEKRPLDETLEDRSQNPDDRGRKKEGERLRTCEGEGKKLTAMRTEDR